MGYQYSRGKTINISSNDEYFMIRNKMFNDLHKSDLEALSVKAKKNLKLMYNVINLRNINSQLITGNTKVKCIQTCTYIYIPLYTYSMPILS